jgi:hypothetical protein
MQKAFYWFSVLIEDMFEGCIKLGFGWPLSRVVEYLTNNDRSDDPRLCMSCQT